MTHNISNTRFDNARAMDVSRVVISRRSVVHGAISVPPGVVLSGNALSGPYFTNFPMGSGSVLRRPNGAGTSSMVVLQQTASIESLILDYEETGGCPDGILTFNAAQNITYCTVNNLHIFGQRVATADLATGCIGINMGAGTSTTVRYFNRFQGVHISDCDIALFLGDQCNANVFSNIQTRECHIHYDFDGDDGFGGGECIENVFSGIGLFSISGALVPDPIGFRMTNRTRGNVFCGVATEMFGQLFHHPWDSTCDNNQFTGMRINEASLSYMEPRPHGIAAEPLNFDDRFARPVNVHQHSAILLPTRTSTDRLRSVGGGKFEYFFRVDGVLPTQNATSGALNEGASYNKVLFRFGNAFTKPLKPNAFVSLRLIMNRAFGAESVLSEHRFRIRKTANSGNVMELDVVSSSVTQTSEVLRGLYFLTGATNTQPFGIAAVIGLGSSANLSYITVDLEVTHNTFDSDARFDSDIRVLSSAATEDVAADDIADALDLLTPGKTAF